MENLVNDAEVKFIDHCTDGELKSIYIAQATGRLSYRLEERSVTAKMEATGLVWYAVYQVTCLFNGVLITKRVKLIKRSPCLIPPNQ